MPKFKRYICEYRNIQYSFGKYCVRFQDACMLKRKSSYCTSDPKIQKEIEDSEDFKAGIIYVDPNFKDKTSKADKKETKADEKAKQDDVKEYADVTKAQDANEILRVVSEEKGVEYVNLRTKEEIKEKAAGLGVSFPNL